MSPITTHVLDLRTGRPAAGVAVLLEVETDGGSWLELARGTTDGDGRLRDLREPGKPLALGPHRLTFETADYFRNAGVATFYPRVLIEFLVDDPHAHHHVPLLLSPFGYSTYRGS